MPARHHELSPFCPRFHRAVELIGRRWTGAIVRALIGGERRYAELRAAIPGLSDRLLSERLRELEEAGVVRRAVDPGPPLRVSYALTEAGRELRAAVEALSAWAERWVVLEPSQGRGTAGTRRGRKPAAPRSS